MKYGILVCLLVCSCTSKVSKLAPKYSDCVIYQVVLREIVAPQGPYVVLDSTRPIFDSIQLPDTSVTSTLGVQIATELVQTYNLLNAQSVALDFCINQMPDVSIESQSSVDRLLSMDSVMQYGWKLFYDRYPGSSGLVYFSKVGYSSDGRYCVVCVGNQRESRAGIGFEVYLKNDSDKWEILHKSVSWIS